MHIRIYQINPERDASRSMFRSYDENRAVNPNEYDNVFDADVDCENLEQIFSQFNTTYHPLFRGRSLSVSDVVELADKGTFHYCDSIGFKEIEFDSSQTHKPENLRKIVVVEPHRKPYVSEVGSDLHSLQKAVDGLIEPIYNDASLLCCRKTFCFMKIICQIYSAQILPCRHLSRFHFLIFVLFAQFQTLLTVYQSYFVCYYCTDLSPNLCLLILLN